MDFLHAFNESIEQFADMYNVPLESAKFIVPGILIVGTIGMLSSGNIADFLAGSIMGQ